MMENNMNLFEEETMVEKLTDCDVIETVEELIPSGNRGKSTLIGLGIGAGLVVAGIAIVKTAPKAKAFIVNKLNERREKDAIEMANRMEEAMMEELNNLDVEEQQVDND